MATIAHLSDIHFGHHDPVIVAAVEAFLADKLPELVVISGDFTQRARVSQYKDACAFVDRIEAMGLPVLAVPGNHDVPLYDIVRRFARPLRRYRRFIDDDLCPWHETETLAALGINTARSLTIKDGSISREQIDMIRASFRTVPESKTKILVTHHPLFAMPIVEEGELSKVVKRHDDALTAVADAGVHILLAGHFHRSFSRSAREMVENAGPALVIQAGTATSTRLRGDERQSFNWIDVLDNSAIELQVLNWAESHFLAGQPARFAFRRGSWLAEAPHSALGEVPVGNA